MKRRFFITLSCISAFTYSMDSSTQRRIERINRQAQLRELANKGNITAEELEQVKKKNLQESITATLQSKNNLHQIRCDRYFLKNDNGFISETRENPTTNLTEQRYFTTNDVAHVSYDHPSLPVDIILKK